MQTHTYSLLAMWSIVMPLQLKWGKVRNSVLQLQLLQETNLVSGKENSWVRTSNC